MGSGSLCHLNEGVAEVHQNDVITALRDGVIEGNGSDFSGTGQCWPRDSRLGSLGQQPTISAAGTRLAGTLPRLTLS